MGNQKKTINSHFGENKWIKWVRVHDFGFWDMSFKDVKGDLCKNSKLDKSVFKSGETEKRPKTLILMKINE